MARKILVVVFSVIVSCSLLPRVCHGGSADVLPPGISSAEVKYSYYFTINKRFGENGNEEDLAADFNATLGSNVFPDLALIEQAFGLPAGSANIGRSLVKFHYKLHDLIVSLRYGLTDKLSLGIKIPYYFNRNEVDASLDTSNATVGINPAVPGGIAPLDIPGTRPLTKSDVQNLLGKGLDTNGDGVVDIPGFGYKRFETWDESGISDIEVGFRYQYLKTDNWRLAFTGGVRLPTGKQNDPDNLVDIGFGSGAWALLFHLNNDYTGIENLVLDATFKYALVLPDKEYLRIPNDPDQPITGNKERVDRNQGDVFEIELSGTYEFVQGLSASLLYNYSWKLQDDVHGDKGYAYTSLEEETNSTAQYFIVGLSYSTIPLFRQEKFPLPLVFGIEYENWFAGSNDTMKQQFISFLVTGFF